MSDKFVKKQMYQCPKCDALFSSKDAAAEHYDLKHDFADKYLGAYIMSNDGKYIGKVLSENMDRDQMLMIEVFRFGSQSKIFSNMYSMFVTRYSVTPEELKSNFRIVTPDVAKEHLSKLFIETGFTALKNNGTIGKNFKELFESDYREKGDDDGN